MVQLAKGLGPDTSLRGATLKVLALAVSTPDMARIISAVTIRTTERLLNMFVSPRLVKRS